MYTVDVDLVLRYVPPMSDHGNGIRLTRTIELPFPPANDNSVYSKDWEGIEDPFGYPLKEVTWDIDRKRFLADTELSVTGTPIAMIPFEIGQLIEWGWKYGSYKDFYQTERKRGRKRSALPAMSICDWDYDEAAEWERSHKNRPKEFKVILHAIASTMAELHNNCGIAYAFLKTGTFFDIPQYKSPTELPPLEKRFYEACREYDALKFDKQCAWSENVRRRYPRLSDVVEAIS